MIHDIENQVKAYSSNLLSLWITHRTTVLWLTTILMALIAVSWLTMNTVFFFREISWGGIDFTFRYTEVHLWFVGQPVYGAYPPAVYPPATYAILWLFHGWLPFFPAKVVWIITTTLALGTLVYFLIRASGAETRLEHLFVVFMLLSMDAVGYAIGHGQLSIHVITAQVAGILVICRGGNRWQEDLLGAVLIILALAKPTISAPFFWMVLFMPGRLRPAVLVISGYVALTLIAIPFQGDAIFPVLQSWASTALVGSEWGAQSGGYGNLHSLLGGLGMQAWNFPLSMLILLALGYWVYQCRHSDLWLLMGVLALIARFWVYHRAYDDVLILLPMIALFRMAHKEASYGWFDTTAGVLLAIVIAVSFASAFKLILPETGPLLKTLRTLTYGGILLFLMYRSWYEKTLKQSGYKYVQHRHSCV